MGQGSRTGAFGRVWTAYGTRCESSATMFETVAR